MRLALNELALTEVCEETAVTILEFLADFVCCLLLFFQIGVNLIPVCQVIGDNAIDLRKCEAWEVLADLFRRRSIPEGVDHAVERDPGTSNSPCTLWSAEEKIWRSL